MTITYEINGSGGTDSDCIPSIGNNEEAKDSRTNSSVLTRVIPTSTTDEESMSWTSLTGNPNEADWPNGLYEGSVNVSAMDANITVKIQLHRTNSGCTTQETVLDDTTGVSVTGVYLFTNTVDPSSGAAGDRAQLRLLGSNSNSHNTRNFTILPDSNGFIRLPIGAAVRKLFTRINPNASAMI